MTAAEKSRLTAVFREARAEGKKVFIPYIMAGDPDLAVTARLVPALAASGAGIIELGVPFSDPVADGPVIQKAAARSLAAGTTLRKVLALVAGLRRETAVPLVLMSYYNPVLRFGLSEFAARAQAAGVDGVIIADLPGEEAGELRQALANRGVDLVPLVAPTTPPGRLAKITALGRGFIYCVSLTGVTGVRDHLAPETAAFLNRVRAVTGLPLAVGFGISNPAMVAAVRGETDGVIMGSALVKLMAENQGSANELVPLLSRFVRDCAGAL